MTTLQGFDASNLNGRLEQYRSQWWYQQSTFGIIQAIPRPAPNGLCAAQLATLREDGKSKGIYSWIWHDPTWRLSPDVATDQWRRLATVPDDEEIHMRPWLDVEDNQSTGWQGVTVQTRIDDVNRALEVLDTWAYGRGLPEAGIYWSNYFISLLFGGQDYWPERKQWKAHYGITPGILVMGNVVAHQYTSTPMDLDVMLESEIVQPGGDPVTDPEREELQNTINGLVSTIGLLTGDDLKPLLRKSAGQYVKDYVTTARARADAVGVNHA